MAENVALPPGFVLDKPQNNAVLPPGFALDKPQRKGTFPEGDSARLTRRGMRQRRQFADTGMLDDLPEETAAAIKEQTGPVGGRGSGAVQSARRRLANLERLRQANPYLAEEIERMPGGEAFLVGAGKYASDISEGAQRLMGLLDQEEAAADEQAYQQLADIRDTASAGRVLAQAGALALPLAKGTQIAATIPRAATTSAVAGLEGGLTAAGQGAEPRQIAAQAAIQAAVAGLGGELFTRGTPINTRVSEFARSGRIFRQSPFKERIKAKIAEGSTDDVTARYIIDGAGSVKALPAAREALKQGFEPGTVALVKGSSQADKQIMRKMVDIIKRGRQSKEYRLQHRPGEAMGESLLRRYQSVKTINRQAGQEVRDAAQGLKGARINIDDDISRFMDDLDDLGIVIDDELKPVFTGSQIKGGGGAASRRLIKDAFDDIKQGGDFDGLDAHKLKQTIQGYLDFDKTPLKPLNAKAENAVSRLQRGINDKLRAISQDYARANDKFSETKQALRSFQKASGRNFDPLSDRSDAFLGNLARRLTSNVQSRIKLEDSIHAMTEAARKYGVQFDDNIYAQAALLDDLERLSKSYGTTSLRGEIEKAGEAIASATAGQETAAGLALRASRATYNRIRSINEENAIKAIEKLLD